MKITYFVEVTSSWCYWAELAWAELKQRYAREAQFHWKIALLPADALAQSQAQCEWFYRRSGTIVRSPFMLNAGWFDLEIKTYTVPNYLAEAAKDLGIADDRVRLALAHAGLREGKKIGRWEIATQIAATAGNLNENELLKRAQSPEIAERVRATTAEFYTLQINQRPAFVLESDIGDRAVFSGVANAAPIAATIDAMLADAAGYTSYAAHFGKTPPS